MDKGLKKVIWLYGEEKMINEVGKMNVLIFCINEDGEKEIVKKKMKGLIIKGIKRE